MVLFYLTDTGLEEKVRYRTELVICDQCRRLTTAHKLYRLARLHILRNILTKLSLFFKINIIFNLKTTYIP